MPKLPDNVVMYPGETDQEFQRVRVSSRPKSAA